MEEETFTEQAAAQQENHLVHMADGASLEQKPANPLFEEKKKHWQAKRVVEV